MKKIGLIFLFSVIFWSCENETDLIIENSLTQEELLKPSDKSNLVVQKLIKNGTKYEDILEGEDFLYVEDLLFTKNIEDYEFMGDKELITNTKQYREPSIVSLFNLRITIYLDPSLRGVYLNSLLQAINRYNNIANCGLFLVYSTSRTSSIVIDPKYDSDDYWGKAQFPTRSRPGKQIYINTRIDGTATSGNARMELFLHEIGHCLGLRHTNWSSNGEGSHGGFWDFLGIRPSSPIHIPGTPTDESDVNSIMWSQINLGFIGFSNFDLISLRTLYPHAYKFREVFNYFDYEPDGEFESSYDVYADVFRDGSYTIPLTLTNTSTAIFYLVTQNYNANNAVSSFPVTKTLAPGSNTYFLNETNEQCSPYQGEVCTYQYLSTTYVN